ncbi:multicopper oxidase domain-containing protein [Streptomyces silvisoli]|uniref:Multicopper oxidase domain-containing protein n=1 Tax=Streptomyces silvisoli TaxID=3034235 RepID=A0ABT5ZX00_9ACTN|nr:multicopper oxidase domain-containing protein [Streptomyces silvisoli]MDF3294352.1 multicopper oxidase domain-containing protein [Streptomyces silvisoli]
MGRRQPRRPRISHELKDTILACLHEITRVRVHFGQAGRYMWHHDILEHEDNQMMRPFRVGPA